MNDTEAALIQAWSTAQACFRAMIDAKSYGDPNAPETQAYSAAEREVDHRLAEARWAFRNDAAGDHHIYPNGVGK